MTPGRLIDKKQQEILLDFLEENIEMVTGVTPSQTSLSLHESRQKWTTIAKRLNTVEDGIVKSPVSWKKYWFLWRHRSLKKAADVRRFQSGPNKLAPLTNMEMRLLKLCGKDSWIFPGSNTMCMESKEKSEDSDSQPLKPIRVVAFPVTRKKSKRPLSRFIKATQNHTATSDEEFTSTPPPKWALEIEERRIAAEERMADALEAIASVMQSQEERQSMLNERLVDSISSIAGTVQDLNNGVQEALQVIHQAHSVHPNGPDIKNNYML